MKTILGWGLALVAGALIVWLLLHAFISPVNGQQQPPAGHVSGPCWACHFVSDTVEVRDVD